MILLSIRRRWQLFCLTFIALVLLAGAFAMLRSQNYTATAEMVLDPAVLADDTEHALANAEAWLRSTAAIREVARSLPRAEVASLTKPDDIWSKVHDMLKAGTARPLGSSEDDSLLARNLLARLSVERVPQSYALQIGFSENEPSLAAALANGFAAQLASRPADPNIAGMRVISLADTDMPEDGPAAWLILAIGASAGIAIGTIAVVVAEHRFNGFTSGADIQSRLKLYHLGSVPLLRSVLPDAASPIDAMVDAPLSGFAEAFRGILVAVGQASSKDTKILAITSALPGEGKSTTAICLARSAASMGETVVIVDCDSRRSGASAAIAGSRRGPGLANLLRGACDLDDALLRDDKSGVWILPSLEMAEASLILGGSTFPKVLATLRTRFDRVIVDTAPILAIATTRSVLPLVDGVIMVVRWRATPDEAVRTALGMMPPERTSWSGVVLTQVDVLAQARYGQGDASVFYQQSSIYYR